MGAPYYNKRMNGKIKPLPSRERLIELFTYDPATGVFTRKKGIKKGRVGDVAGTVSCGYVSIGVDWKIYRAHRLAWVYMTGVDPMEMEVDHANGDPLDNRFENLRLASHPQNTRNKKASASSKTGVKGVYYDKSRSLFCAEVIHEGRKHRLGRFKTCDEAKAAYDAAARMLHGDFHRS